MVFETSLSSHNDNDICASFNLNANEAGEVERLRHLSPYATVSGIAARRLLKDVTPQHRSLNDLFSLWYYVPVEELSGRAKCENGNQQSDVVIKAAENGDIPVEYLLRGILPHEFPVIGVHVDKRLAPGFRYSVRYLGRNGQRLWGGEARTLLNVGMGYGKRLTFLDPASLNSNEVYFWSDSDPQGFAFAIEAVSRKTKMGIYTPDDKLVGEVLVESIIAPQEELKTIAKRGNVTKHVRVVFQCFVTYYRCGHDLIDLHAHDVETVEGEAILVKQRGNLKAVLERVENVLFRTGPCTLRTEF